VHTRSAKSREAHETEVSRPEKIFFPGSGITKGDVVEYYRRIAKTILPHLRGRPLVLQRFPDGLRRAGFFQKDVPEYFPDWIPTVSLKKEGGQVRYALCDNTATVVYLANQACLTLHAWLSRKPKWDYPDRMIFDLDPPGKEFQHVSEAASGLRKLMEALDLEPFVMATGSRGLHVVVPLDRTMSFDLVRDFARDVAELLAERHPQTLTTEMRKNRRRGRLYLDTMRNAYGQTVVAPYTVRAKPEAPVATPLEWNEISAKLNPHGFTLRNIFQRLHEKEDPWRRINRHAHSLKTARRRLDEMIARKK
jgi:bifunctional non-homologous end joining protein LigD